MTPEQILDLGPLGVGAVAVWLLGRFVVAFTRTSDDAREYLAMLRAHLEAQAKHREQEQEYWTEVRQYWQGTDTPLRGFVVRD